MKGKRTKTISIKQTRENPTKNRRPRHKYLELVKGLSFERWSDNSGGPLRYKRIFIDKLKKKPLLFLERRFKNNKNTPTIMVLGPGDGGYTALLNIELKKIGVNSFIDVLGFSKSVDKEIISKGFIRKEFSPEISKAKAFEHLNPVEEPKITRFIKGNYDLVIAEKSVGTFTESRPYTLLQTSLLLKKNGRAYIEVLHNNDLKQVVLKYQRMLNSFNKKNKLDLKFKLEMMPDTLENVSTGKLSYIQITRD